MCWGPDISYTGVTELHLTQRKFWGGGGGGGNMIEFEVGGPFKLPTKVDQYEVWHLDERNSMNFGKRLIQKNLVCETVATSSDVYKEGKTLVRG